MDSSFVHIAPKMAYQALHREYGESTICPSNQTHSDIHLELFLGVESEKEFEWTWIRIIHKPNAPSS